MDDVTRHPDDAALFDLVEGALEPARASLVERHLARCSACAAFVAAARSGRDAACTEVVAMPADRAEQLAVAMRTAWRERRDGVLAAEQEADDAPTTVMPAVPAVERTEWLEAIPTSTAQPRTRRGRRLVPILAFAVLATLAGTSVYVGEERVGAPDRTTSGGSPADDTDQQDETASSAGDPGSSSPQEPEAFESTEDAAGGVAAPTAAAPVEAPIEGDPSASAPPVAPGDDGTQLGAPAEDALAELEAGGRAEGAGGPGLEGGAATETERAGAELDAFDCIATRDQTALALPDGRIPQRIVRGPLGIYVVCG